MEELIKIIGIGLIALVIVIILKQYKPEYTIYVSIIAGILIGFGIGILLILFLPSTCFRLSFLDS